MKKLYSCNATCDNNQMYSYNTKLVEFITMPYGSICVSVWRYPSMTSQQHLRKYAQWLAEKGETQKSALLTACLNESVKQKKREIMGYLVECEIKVECF